MPASSEQQPQEDISGLIERVTFHSEEPTKQALGLAVKQPDPAAIFRAAATAEGGWLPIAIN